MKKLFYLVLTLMFTACFNDSLNESNTFDVFLEKWDGLIPYQNVCTSATDAFKFPENWTREDLDNFENLAAENFYSMSTCGLLETLLDHPTNRMLGPWCTTCSNSNLPGVTLFNNKLREDKIVTELFERNDRFSVLASKYLTIIKDKKEHSGQIAYFEMLLASDMCMTSLNESEKTMFMAMALEKVKDKSENIHIDETYHIIVAIMKSSNYEPFLNEFGTEWTESLIGYTICYVSQNEILKYAKQFLNEQK